MDSEMEDADRLQSPPSERYSIVLVAEHDRILLGMQKNEFGNGRWNGVRGKILEEETAENAAVR